ncbi:MAG: type II secretion system protein GspG [Candidatus Omnitrophota bacterium]
MTTSGFISSFVSSHKTSFPACLAARLSAKLMARPLALSGESSHASLDSPVDSPIKSGEGNDNEPNRPNNRTGFTIIELLVVIAIIMILAGLVTGVAYNAKKKALTAKAKASISAIETALSMFNSDIGDYPSPGNKNLITCLTTSTGCLVGGGVPLSAWQAANWNGPYMNFQTNEINSGGELVDPWNNPYVYAAGTDHGTGANYVNNYVDIYSFGPNGLDEHLSNPPGDDIVNWRK